MKNLCWLILFCASGLYGQTVSEADASHNAGKVQWSARKIDLGVIQTGHTATQTLWVKNLTREKLSILQVTSSCHCITVDWQKGPIKKGKKARIDITFQPEVPGDFYRLVTVTTNFDPAQSVAFPVTGKVVEAQ